MIVTSLDQLDTSKLYTFADYLNWAFTERVELIRGRLVKMSPAPGKEHQRIAGNLYGLFWYHFKDRSCQFFPAPFDVRLPVPKGDQTFTVVQPDLCVVCDPDKLDEKGCYGAPDLIVEILSPGNAKTEMTDKFDVYQESGVLEYWLIDPLQKVLIIYVRNEDGQFIGQRPLAEDDQVQSKVFPNLTIDLSDVFRSIDKEKNID